MKLTSIRAESSLTPAGRLMRPRGEKRNSQNGMFARTSLPAAGSYRGRAPFEGPCSSFAQGLVDERSIHDRGEFRRALAVPRSVRVHAGAPELRFRPKRTSFRNAGGRTNLTCARLCLLRTIERLDTIQVGNNGSFERR